MRPDRLLSRADPYLITGPARISFSGGRTSAYMLHQILQAHNGKLPDDVVVAFANTGKEREETLRFVHECGSRWNVKVHWLEWRSGSNTKSMRVTYDEVGYNSASRNGEPFSGLIAEKQRLPNRKERFCTSFLKIAPMNELARSKGWEPGHFTEVIGLRHDEGLRILNGLAGAEKHGLRVAYPLAKAKVTKLDVMAFWARQPFDLDLEPWEGNCDLCFLKGCGLRKRIIRDDPSRAAWWAQQERARGGWFDKDNRVAALEREVHTQPYMPGLLDDDEEYDAECGLTCAAEAA